MSHAPIKLSATEFGFLRTGGTWSQAAQEGVVLASCWERLLWEKQVTRDLPSGSLTWNVHIDWSLGLPGTIWTPFQRPGMSHQKCSLTASLTAGMRHGWETWGSHTPTGVSHQGMKESGKGQVSVWGAVSIGSSHIASMWILWSS